MKFYLAFSLLLVSSVLFGQDTTYNSTSLYRIVVTNGDDFTGYITNQDSASVSLKTKRFGTIRIQWIDIKRISELHKGDTLPMSKRVTDYPIYRNFSQPTSFPLEKGRQFFRTTICWLIM